MGEEQGAGEDWMGEFDDLGFGALDLDEEDAGGYGSEMEEGQEEESDGGEGEEDSLLLGMPLPPLPT